MPKLHHNDFLPLPSIETLQECFDYAPETGELYWKCRPRKHFVSDHEYSRWNTRFAGTIAGKVAERSIRVKINNIRYRAHRLIIKLTTGRDPLNTVDHKGGNPLDNRHVNLRVATMGEQAWNRKTPKTNTSGYRGAVWHRKSKKWMASIVHRGTRYHLGQFNTAEEAAAVYENKARELRGEFYRYPSHG